MSRHGRLGQLRIIPGHGRLGQLRIIPGRSCVKAIVFWKSHCTRDKGERTKRFSRHFCHASHVVFYCLVYADFKRVTESTKGAVI